MKKTSIIAAATLFLSSLAANAAVEDGGVKVSDVRTERHGDLLSVSMEILLSGLDVEPNRAVLLTPRLVNGADTLSLPPVAVYGRKRYYYYKRNFGEYMLSGSENETSFLSRNCPEAVPYAQVVPYADWFGGADLVLDRSDYGCCRALLAHTLEGIGTVTFRDEFFPSLVYLHPAPEAEKRRQLEGRSYVDFPVDQTIIYPDYRNNLKELAVIRATIDTVRNDPDARIDTVWLKGFASPESPYAHNTDLAKGRTEALKRYINNMYNFTGVEILTDYEPENWEGLRRFVEGSNLAHRQEILALIDSNMEPDPKEWKIKMTYPEDYRFMLTEYYPALRRTDYRVSYVVRSYSDPAEILRIMRTTPQHLSLEEFYLAASRLEPGSEEFTEVYETAVRLFPLDETANLNAANAAMRRGDNAAAERYLEKAGQTPEAFYARGALKIRQGDMQAARSFLQAARQAGIEQATTTLQEMEQRGM